MDLQREGCQPDLTPGDLDNADLLTQHLERVDDRSPFSFSILSNAPYAILGLVPRKYRSSETDSQNDTTEVRKEEEDGGRVSP
jgi:hypothetical protein